ncbi:response regulator [Paraburkholderia dipogonis]|uniref:response regulator n=1 Tax=Paraburkholderia dipogonis TaxID=1211383 RepID=UPI001FCC33BD|nr:response regulator [Paraburkholderia dipogonis]
MPLPTMFTALLPSGRHRVVKPEGISGGTRLAEFESSFQPHRAMSTVLLVDDDFENQWALQLALESRRHRVVLAGNGCDALRKATENFPDLVITDFQIPNWTAGSCVAT